MKKMNKSKIVGMALLILPVSNAGFAQDISDLSNITEVFGGITNTLGSDFALQGRADAYTFSATPAFVKKDNLDIYGGSISFANSNKYSIEGSAFTINPRTGETLDSWGLKYKHSLPKPSDSTSISLVAKYSDTEDFSTEVEALVAGSYSISENLSVTANLGWKESDPESSSSVDDFTQAIGLSYSIPDAFIISADFKSENDIDTEDKWSLKAIIPVELNSDGAPALWIFGIDDNNGVIAAFKYTF